MRRSWVVKEALSQPQAVARDMVVETDHQMLGKIPIVNRSIKFPGDPQPVPTAPPVLGQHTDEILRDILGLTSRADRGAARIEGRGLRARRLMQRIGEECPMPELRFDDRVAVITGAGRGLGRAYALLLASRGAKIVVNDPGASLKGDGIDAGPAQEVVQEIRAAGGEAVACTESVATPEGGKAIIQSALDHYGRIDILIHNAGIVRRASLKEMTYADFEFVLDVHLRGAFHVVRPAFPLMCKAGYGRIVLTSSINGLYGNCKTVNYSVAKAGIIGLSNVAALEGAEHNVKSNVILPGAVTRMSEGIGHLAPTRPWTRRWWRLRWAGWRMNPARSRARC